MAKHRKPDASDPAEGFMPDDPAPAGGSGGEASGLEDEILTGVKTDEAAVLQAQIDELKGMLATSAAAGTVAPPGYKIVRDEPTQDAKSLAEQAAIKAEIDKGHVRRTQEHADRLFPEGRHRFRCVLPDRNGHPELVISAANETDAAGRYMAACGINHTEHKVEVVRA